MSNIADEDSDFEEELNKREDRRAKPISNGQREINEISNGQKEINEISNGQREINEIPKHISNGQREINEAKPISNGQREINEISKANRRRGYISPPPTRDGIIVTRQKSSGGTITITPTRLRKEDATNNDGEKPEDQRNSRTPP